MGWNRAVSRGFTRGVTRRLYALPMTRTRSDGGVKLSRRQAQILEGIGRGNTYRTLAERLAISPATVSYHVGQLQQKLRTPTLPALIGLAIVSGILSNDQFPLELTGNLVVADDFLPEP